MYQLKWNRIILFTGLLVINGNAQIKNLPWECTFEKGFCGFTRDERGSSPRYEFQLRKGPTPSDYTGPIANEGHGYYIYMEASHHQPGETVCVKSPALPYRHQDSCLHFEYNVHGMHVDRLYVIIWMGDYAEPTWMYQGDHKQNKYLYAWQNGNQTIPREATNFGFKAVRGGSDEGEPFGDICVDNIELKSGPCDTAIKVAQQIRETEGETWPQDNSQVTALRSIHRQQYPSEPQCDIAKTLQFCNFDGATELSAECGFYNFDGGGAWYHEGPSMSDSSSKPNVDYTPTSEAGKFLYIPTTNTQTSILSSPPLTDVGGPFCLKFAYHMRNKGGEAGTLSVLVAQGGAPLTMWTATGNKGDAWKVTQITLSEGTNMVGLQVSDGGGIALDDIKLIYSGCDVLETCTEADFTPLPKPTDAVAACNWDYSDNSECMNNMNPYFQWVRHRGPTPTPNTGPSVDHTLGTMKGYFMYTEVSGISGGEVAVLRTPYFPGTGYYCVGFWYHMFGTEMGNLVVTAYSPSTPQGFVMFNISGFGHLSDQGWVRLQKTTPLNTNYLDFNGIKKNFTARNQTRGDMAIDDLMVTSGPCKGDEDLNPIIDIKEPELDAKESENIGDAWASQDTDTDKDNAWPPKQDDTDNAWPSQNEGSDFNPPNSENVNTSPPLTNPPANEWPVGDSNKVIDRNSLPPPPIPSCTAVLTLQECTFDANPQLTELCSWHNSGAEGKWLHHVGSQGKYLYVNLNQRARLSSPSLRQFGGPFCLSFGYYLDGQSVGEIRVLVEYAGEPPQEVWAVNDQKGYWRFARRSLMEGTERIQIVATSGGPTYLDNVQLMLGTCEGIDVCKKSVPHSPTIQPLGTVYSCDVELSKVESKSYCQIQDDGKDYGWRRNKGNTPTMHTGPDVDNTFGDDTGHYMYLEVSGAPAGTSYSFFTPDFYSSTNQKPFCVSFCYHMFGDAMGMLRVYAETLASGRHEIFSQSQDLNEWKCVSLTVPWSDTRRLQFEGSNPTSAPYGDIAVDDLRVTSGSCQAPTDAITPSPPAQPTVVTPKQIWDLNTGWEDCEVTEPKAVCTFEDTMDPKCKFDNMRVSSSQSNLMWTLHVGPQKEHPGALHSHHATFLKGNYWYINSENRRAGDRAVLFSPPFSVMTGGERRDNWAVSFRFHMRGSTLNTLSFYTREANEAPDRQRWTRRTNNGDALVTVNVPGNIENFYFAGEIGPDAFPGGDIAVDNVTVQSWCLPITQEIKKDSCPEMPCQPASCAHRCSVIDMKSVCSCLNGYMLMSDKRKCADINECESSPCQDRCINTPGSYVCVGKCTRKKR